jgi:ribosomal protein S18 acetylase RimI-like enzyme
VADVSVRPARPEDGDRVAQVQLATWQAAYADLLPAAALALDPTELAEIWTSSLAAPPSPRHRLLVAVDGGEVVGFAASEPATEPEAAAELTALLVEPRWGRRGHGSRLLTASVDHWREDGAAFGVTWVFDQDAVVSDFLASAGWGPDTVGRALETDDRVVHQRRWHTAL